MKKIFNAKLLNSPVSQFLYFFALGAICLFVILQLKPTTAFMVQVILILVVITIFATRILMSTLDRTIYSYLGAFTPITLLIFMLIFSTGNVSSQFLVLSHLFAIGLAFLVSPTASLSFVLATTLLMLTGLAYDEYVKDFVLGSPLYALLYFSSYVALVPFAYILSREYKLKDGWNKILEKQISAFKAEEDELLKNIVESVIVTDQNFKIIYVNEKAKQYTNKTDEINGKNLLNTFSFMDDSGTVLNSESLTFKQAFLKKTPQNLTNVEIRADKGRYLRADMKILPVIQDNNPVGLILIITEISGLPINSHDII